MLSERNLKEIKALLAEISQGAWEWAAGAGGSLEAEKQRDWLLGCYDNTPREVQREIMLVHVEKPKAVTVAITGNGEHGEANAAFIAAAPAIVRELLKEVDRLKAENNVLKAVNRLNEDGLG